MIKTLLSLLFFVPLLGCAQTISGTYLNDQNQPFEFVKVSLLSEKDSTRISALYTDSKGAFEFSGMGVGTFLISANYTGFTESWTSVVVESKTAAIRLPLVALSIDKALELEGVEAKGSLDALKAGIDKKIYSTSEDLVSRGGTVQDVLSNIPSITVDQDGNVSLRGDGNVVILINGRPSALAMGDGKNLLNSLPANSIERIEVVTNPSAKYDPDGTSGIINIVLKKNRLKGFNGVVSATAATGNLFEATTALSFQNQKFNLYTNYSFNYREGYRNYNNQVDRDASTDSASYLDQIRDGLDLEVNHTVVLGADYSFNDQNILSFIVTGSNGIRKRTGDLFTLQRDAYSDTVNYYERSSDDPENTYNGDFNLNFVHKFKEEKGEYSINTTYSLGTADIKGYYDQTNFYTNYLALSELPIYQRLTNDEFNENFAVQFDLSRIYKKISARAEWGAKSIVSNNQLSTYSEAYSYTSESFEEDTISNFDYAFHFEVHSIYGIWGQELGKFKYQVGLRGEYAVQEPNLISEDYKVPTDYLNVFPSGHLKYQLKGKSELSLSYSRRINRPKSGQLNPFTSYADPFNLRSGNPFLQPEYIDSYDLGYSVNKKKVVFSMSVFHRRTKDVINRVKLFNSDNSAYVTFANIDMSESTGAEVVTVIKLFDWLKNTFSANMNYIQYRNGDPLTNWNNDGLNWSLKNMLAIEFWKKTASLQVNYAYNAPMTTPQGIAQRKGGLDIAVSKDFLKGALMVTVRGSDLFDKIGFNIDFDNDGIEQVSNYKWLTRRAYISISYKFGKNDLKIKSPRVGGGGED